ncbi:transporter substrate-binding domain-containing protein [uncultured Halovibrio sp.]|uniref:substrate-binding periplasmic protein n=1 Tax=uncultured Halovibrio sp. TaxID=985049 RepID=UPI0025EE13B9|nr:transporter substrate-binding domain-containing protein [uncultured Halovibrio sp.]
MSLRRSSRTSLFMSLLFSILLLSTEASAQTEPEPLEFGYIHLPPFGYTDSEGQSKGYLVELARQVFSAMDQPVRFVQHPATRLYRQIDSGETAFTLAAADLHRLKNTAVEAEEPAITLNLTVYHRKDTQPVSDVEQLKGHHVVLMKGYSYGQLGRFFEAESDAMRITEARTHQSALQMIQFGRADYLLNYQTSADTTIAQHGLTGLESDVIARLDVHFFVSKMLANAQALADDWDQNLRDLKQHDRMPSKETYNIKSP